MERTVTDRRVNILIVDDEPDVREIVRDALEMYGYGVRTAGSAMEGLSLLREVLFDLVMTDIAMPEMDGVELLEHIVDMHPDLPVVVITGHGDADVARSALTNGAVDFVTKPFSAHELPVVVERNLTRRALERARLAARSEEVLFEAIAALTAALDAKDAHTANHATRVTGLSLLAADELHLSSEERFVVQLAAQMHDIGKIGVRFDVLTSAGGLDEAELEHVRVHAVKGAEIMSRLRHVPQVSSCILHHHERYDGGGYPHGLAGEVIPLGARIIAVADSFEAMVSDRPYRQAIPFDQAMVELSRGAGTQFDPSVVDAFKRVMETRRGDIEKLYEKAV